jgi:hypothetical protein
MTSREFRLDATGTDLIGGLQTSWMPQKDGCCGPFWGAIALRAFGIERFEDEAVDQDLLAVQSGTTLDDEGDPYEALPPRSEPRLDYRLPLPVADHPAASGTSAHAVADGIERVGEGQVSVLPVAGPWTPESVEALLDTVAEVTPDAVLIANWATRHLWGSHPTPQALLAHLAGRDDVGGPPAEWDVGHFANLVGLLRGPGRSFVVVRDSYPSLGWEGHHLQPPTAAAAALRRGDGKEGGVLVALRAQAGDEMERRLEERGFELRHWNNGTPYEGS